MAIDLVNEGTYSWSEEDFYGGKFSGESPQVKIAECKLV